jgi:hypothetical protein
LRRLKSRIFLTREASRSTFSGKIPPVQEGGGYLISYLEGARVVYFIEEEPIFVNNVKILRD